ncbi:MAG: tripartite tricarboxylate transporter permease [Acidaminococcales bacterium]|jgi:putative tricarboxylic transport membrane protein|nr:tripartite tricarboxylate transporter permease [Acidaminococcales bacterium]
MEFQTLEAIPGALFAALSPECLGWICLGTVVGVLFGAAPGLTATTAVALFTPITFYMSLNVSLSFLMGIYCGGFYAGSIPAILINTPGAPGNAATVMDGYPMAKQGRAGEALGHSIISSWLGGSLSAFALLIFAPLIAAIALKFGAPEYFAVAVLGLVCIAGVSGRSMIKGVAGAAIGMFLGTVGMDPIDGLPRFTMDNLNLMGGIALIPALVGLFAITEVLAKVETVGRSGKDEIIVQVKKMLPPLKYYWQYKGVIIKSTIIGVIIGAIPGTGPTIASWMSYNEAKRSSKHPQDFGTGIPEGIMASESSNNAVTGGALIPLLTLGVPGDTVTAVLLGALMIQGLTPGPMLLVERYDLVAFLLWILLIANVVMLAMGLLGSKYFPYILKIPFQILMPIVSVLCVTGGYAVNNSFFDAGMVVVIGFAGYILLKLGFPVAPIVLGLILGPIIEPNMRRALLGHGLNPLVFFSTPISAGLLISSFVLVYIMNKRGRMN